LYVRAGSCMGIILSSICDVDLIYPDNGLVLRMGLPERTNMVLFPEEVKIKPKSKVSFVIFVPPEIEGYALAFPANGDIRAQLVNWVGFGYYEVTKP
jgi:hypothetical protein